MLRVPELVCRAVAAEGEVGSAGSALQHWKLQQGSGGEGLIGVGAGGSAGVYGNDVVAPYSSATGISAL